MKAGCFGVGLAAVSSAVASRIVGDRKGWERQNFTGQSLSLRGGVLSAAVAVGASSLGVLVSGKSLLPAALLTGVSAWSGYIDDMDQGERDGKKVAKGLRGHLTALKDGYISTGLVKLAAIGGASALAALTLGRRRGKAGLGDWLAGASMLAAGTNMINLLDLRPVRARKGVLALSLPLSLVSGPAGTLGGIATVAAAKGFSQDAKACTMLGDTGANALGALTFYGLAKALPLSARYGGAALLVALTFASEKVSFSEVIDSVDVLRKIDSWGRPDGR